MKIPTNEEFIKNISKSSAREDKRRIREDRAKRKKFLQKVEVYTKSLTKSLVLQIKRGEKRPTVILPDRGTELCKAVAERLKEIFSNLGYRPLYDTDPSISSNVWTDLGWQEHLESDPNKPPTFIL